MTTTVQALEALGACPEAAAFATGFDSLQAAWNVCESGDWMEWLLDKVGTWPEGARAEYERVRAAAIRRLVPTVPELPRGGA